MNVMGLVTRGYLGGGLVISPEPPDVTEAVIDVPDLRGAALVRTPSPSGRGAAETGPSLRRGKVQHKDPAGAPSIVGSKTDKPAIRKK
jgi:hypothetical protein